MRKILLLLSVLWAHFCNAQGDQTIINVPINATGTTFKAILHLPKDYSTTQTKYPLLMFFHGAGQATANPSDIYTSSSSGGPSYYIGIGSWPDSFRVNGTGVWLKPIVVSPQAYPPGAQQSTTAQELDFILTYLYSNYRVDTTHVTLTGLSDGGQTVSEYMGKAMSTGTKFTKSHNIAAAIIMSENGSGGLIQAEADTAVKDSVGLWVFGSTDEQGANTLSMAYYGNLLSPGYVVSTSYTGGHCCWGQFYTPSFVQVVKGQAVNLYQWMLGFKSKGSPPSVVVTPPVVAPTCPTCPPPVVCPVCPAIPKQRNVVGWDFSRINGVTTILFTFDDGSQQTMSQ